MTHSYPECVIDDANRVTCGRGVVTHYRDHDALLTRFHECVTAVFPSFPSSFSVRSDVMTQYLKKGIVTHTHATRTHMKKGFDVGCVIASQVSL